MKVIGLGLNKTGTTSLGRALEILGFKDHLTWNDTYTKYWYDGEYEKLLEIAGKYNNIEDWPWPLLYSELDNEFSDAYFIHTYRKDENKWYYSQCKHFERTSNAVFSNKLVYGYENPFNHKEEYIEFYKRHNDMVKQYFRNRDNFISVCWEEGDGWKELCDFLNKKVPKESFPFLNRSKSPNILQKIASRLFPFI